MTKMIIDNKAGCKNSYEVYEIDRRIYETVEDLEKLVYECMNSNVFMITVEIDGKEIIRRYCYR